jgi:hypothetical protein
MRVTTTFDKKIELERACKEGAVKLREMGLDAHIDISGDSVFIVIGVPSILRLIEKQINHPNKRVIIEDKYMVVKLW